MNGSAPRRSARLGAVASCLALVAAASACHSPSNDAPPPPPAPTPAPSTPIPSANAGGPSVPVSTSKDPLPAGGAVVVLTASSASVKGEPDVDVAPIPSDSSHGFAAALKPGGENDLFVTPLGNALSARPAFDTLTVMGDPSLSYRLLVEVLFTAQKAHKAPLDDCFAVRPANAPPKELHAVCIDQRHPPDAAAQTMRLTVLMLPEGFVVKVLGATLGSTCDGPGAGVTVPRSGQDFDYTALGACLANAKHKATAAYRDDSSVTISAGPETTLQALVSTMDAARTGPSGESLFPNVTFAVNRPGAR